MKPCLALALVLSAAPVFAAEDCCASAPAETPVVAAAASIKSAPATPAGHPLRGVIVAVLPDKSSLLVKHDEIPGVMSAMTMLLKVDSATLATAKKGEAISATLIKKADGWWLENVTPAPAPAPTVPATPAS